MPVHAGCGGRCPAIPSSERISMVDFVLLSHPRSGSSALRHAMNTFPSVVIPREAGFATWLMRDPVLLEAEGESGGAQFAELFTSALLRTRKFEHWNLPKDSAIRRLRTSGATSIRHAVDEIYRLYRDTVRPHASVIGDKNNSFFFAVDEALRALGPARVVLLWRDPVEVWSSYQRLRRDAAREPSLSNNPYFPRLPGSREEFIHAWTVGHEMAVGHLDEWSGPTWYCSFSSFVTDGPLFIRRLIEFVTGAPAEETVEVPAALWEPEDLKPWKSGVGRPVHRRESRAGAEHVPPEDAAEIRERTREVQQRLISRERFRQ